MAKKTRVLLTGFSSFEGHEINPSAEIVKAVLSPAKVKLFKAIIEVDFGKVKKGYPKFLDKKKPDLIINVGFSTRASALELEHFAHNEAIDPYHSGKKGFKVKPRGLAKLNSKIDLRKLAGKICQKGIPAVTSVNAGTYLCNYIYYLSLDWCAKNGGNALFIHVPYDTSTAALHSLKTREAVSSIEFKKMVKAIEASIRELRT